MSGHSHGLIEILLSPIGGFFTLWVLFKMVEVVWWMFTPEPREFRFPFPRFESAASNIRAAVIQRLNRRASLRRP